MPVFDTAQGELVCRTSTFLEISSSVFALLSSFVKRLMDFEFARLSCRENLANANKFVVWRHQF
jgi:hypothetical protein